MDVEAESVRIFPTNVQKIEWPGELNESLKAELWKKRALNPEGIYRSNAAGTWHSQDDVLTTCGSAGEELGQMFFDAFKLYAQNHTTQPGEMHVRLAAWAMMYTDGGYATVHTHPNCHFSGVYYVDVGDSEEKTMATGVRVTPGTIEFIDTRGTGALQVPGLNLQPAARFVPKEGQMLCFPSWLPHFVHPVSGPGVRIAIACNATVLKYIPKEE